MSRRATVVVRARQEQHVRELRIVKDAGETRGNAAQLKTKKIQANINPLNIFNDMCSRGERWLQA